jgi:hypothetical protein
LPLRGRRKVFRTSICSGLLRNALKPALVFLYPSQSRGGVIFPSIVHQHRPVFCADAFIVPQPVKQLLLQSHVVALRFQKQGLASWHPPAESNTPSPPQPVGQFHRRDCHPQPKQAPQWVPPKTNNRLNGGLVLHLAFIAR